MDIAGLKIFVAFRRRGNPACGVPIHVAETGERAARVVTGNHETGPRQLYVVSLRCSRDAPAPQCFVRR